VRRIATSHLAVAVPDLYSTIFNLTYKPRPQENILFIIFLLCTSYSPLTQLTALVLAIMTSRPKTYVPPVLGNYPPLPKDPDYVDGLWDWTVREARGYLPTSPRPDTIFRTMECWKYEDERDKAKERKEPPVTKHETKDLRIEAIGPWLQTPYPLHEGKPPSSGYKILLASSEFSVLPPLSRESTDYINAMFGLPPVENHYSSMDYGASGMFLKSDGSYGNPNLDPKRSLDH
jgi:hypothetical protein